MTFVTVDPNDNSEYEVSLLFARLEENDHAIIKTISKIFPSLHMETTKRLSELVDSNPERFDRYEDPGYYYASITSLYIGLRDSLAKSIAKVIVKCFEDGDSTPFNYQGYEFKLFWPTSINTEFSVFGYYADKYPIRLFTINDLDLLDSDMQRLCFLRIRDFINSIGYNKRISKLVHEAETPEYIQLLLTYRCKHKLGAMDFHAILDILFDVFLNNRKPVPEDLGYQNFHRTISSIRHHCFMSKMVEGLEKEHDNNRYKVNEILLDKTKEAIKTYEFLQRS